MESVAEVWKDVIGYEGKYQVSSHGRVRSLDRIVKSRHNNGRISRGRMLKPVKHEYLQLMLGAGNPAMIHTLVAEAFLGPRPSGFHINHIDGTRVNNHF